MGNAQSAEAPRRASQKLSKPKTGNHAAAGLLGPGSFSNSTRRLSNAQLPNPPALSPSAVSTPTTLSAAEAPGGLSRRVDSCTSLQSVPSSQGEPKRRSLFRSMSTRGAAGSISRNPSVGPGRRMVDRLTGATSMTYESAVAHYGQAGPDSWPVQPESRTSWNYNLSSYEAQRLLNLGAESGLEQATAMSENKMTVVTETTWKSSNPAQPPSGRITRASSDVSLYMPVRRQSIIQTPGVATRTNSTRDLPSLPQPNFRHSHPPTPSLSRKQSVESYRSGIMSMPPLIREPESVERVVTPCEDKYLSIGAFKLGSLRITNGSPSPATPEAERSCGNEGLGTGNSTAWDGSFSETPAHETGSTTVAASQRLVQQPPNFMPEITQHPLPSPPRPKSPALQTTSKATALDDNLFDDDAHPEYFSVEVLDVRLDPSAKPPHALAERDADTSVTRTDSGFVSAASPSSEASHKPLAKADSGYSSNVSLRSFQAEHQVAEKQPISASLEKRSSQPSRHMGALARSETLAASGETEALYPNPPEMEPPPPPVPPKDFPRTLPNGMARKSNSMHNLAEKDRLKPIKPTRPVPYQTASLPSGDRGPLPPESVPCKARSARSSTLDNAGSAPSADGRLPQKPGRFQRLLSGARRSATGTPIVHSTQAVEQGSVPPVPQQVEHRLREHAGRFPVAAKRLALRPRSSMDTLKTIFSVGSMEASLDAVNSLQTVATGPEHEARGGARKQTLHSAPVPVTNVAAYVISRKSITRKPVPVPRASAKVGGQEVASSERNGVVPASSVNAAASPRSPSAAGSTKILAIPSGRRSRRASDLDLAQLTTDLPSPPLPSPLARAISAESRTREPQPVNPLIRPLSLRVPPPLRPRSSVTGLSRKVSREGIQSYPAAQTLTSKASMDSLYGYTSSQPEHLRPPSGVSMDPRRLQSFRQYHNSRSSPPDSPNWDAQTDNGVAFRISQACSTSGGSRRNSISSVQSEGVYGTQGWQARAAQQTLRHRASYDSSTYPQRFPQFGYPPSMSNGYTAPVELARNPRAAAWGRSDPEAPAGQWYQRQDGWYPPNVPQGHYWNRSMGNRTGRRGPNPPYRVLHSYNSPAYRNAPIWG